MLEMAKRNSYILCLVCVVAIAFYIVAFRIMHLTEYKIFLNSQETELSHPIQLVNVNNDKSDLGYCSTSEHKYISNKDRYTYVSGDEGTGFIGKDYFELNHLSISIRHGDRNAIHLMPHDANQISTQHTSSSVWLDDRAFDYLQYIHPEVFQVKLISNSIVNNDIIYTLSTKLGRIFPVKEIRDSNPDTNTINTEVHELDNAQLTTRGFMQHISLGKWLNKQYSEYIRNLKRKNQHLTSSTPSIQSLLHASTASSLTSQAGSMYIRSTGYDRTVQSVTALLLGLFPVLTDKNNSDKRAGSDIMRPEGNSPAITVYVIHKEDLENMHGVGK